MGLQWTFSFIVAPNGEMILSPLLISPFGVALKCHFLFDPKRWNDLQFKIISPIGVALKSPFLFDPKRWNGMEPIAHFTVWGQIKIDILMLPQTMKSELDWKLL